LLISGGIDPEILLFLNHSHWRVLERLPMELGKFPCRLLPSSIN
jgi:hypothetical protein